MSTEERTRHIGPHSRIHRLSKPDGRTREAKRLKAITQDLLAHVGGAGHVSAPQRYLIERTAIDILRLELLDGDMATGRVSDHSARIAHALRNSVRRCASLARGPQSASAERRQHDHGGAKGVCRTSRGRA